MESCINCALPVEGFCVVADIPSTEKSAKVIGGLRSADIKHVLIPSSAFVRLSASQGPSLPFSRLVTLPEDITLMWTFIT